MPALRVLVVAGDLVPAARRIRVDADTVGALRDQVLEKMLGGGGEAHAGVEVCVSGARGPVAIAAMSQLRDKCKLELRLAAGGEGISGADVGASAAAEDRRERMRSAFANMDVAAESPRTPRGGGGGGGGGGGDDDDDDDAPPDEC